MSFNSGATGLCKQIIDVYDIKANRGEGMVKIIFVIDCNYLETYRRMIL